MSNPFTKNDPRINRRGRPRKGKSLTDILGKHLRKRGEKGADGKYGASNKDRLAAALIDLALVNKDIHAIKYIMDRIDGKPRESVKLTGEVGHNVHIYMPENGRTNG